MSLQYSSAKPGWNSPDAAHYFPPAYRFRVQGLGFGVWGLACRGTWSFYRRHIEDMKRLSKRLYGESYRSHTRGYRRYIEVMIKMGLHSVCVRVI